MEVLYLRSRQLKDDEFTVYKLSKGDPDRTEFDYEYGVNEEGATITCRKIIQRRDSAPSSDLKPSRKMPGGTIYRRPALEASRQASFSALITTKFLMEVDAVNATVAIC